MIKKEHIKNVGIVMGFLVLVGCSPKVTTDLTKSYEPLDYREEVVILQVSDPVPENATRLGKVKIGDTGFTTDCGWDVVKAEAKKEARKAGGNVVKIIELQEPNLASTCYRIQAIILRVEDKGAVAELKGQSKPKVDSSWNYAMLYVYRPSGAGALVGYDVYLGDSVICRATNNSAQKVKIMKKGLNKLWAKTESKSEIPIDVEFGREYYLKCTINMGFVVGRPQLNLVSPELGKMEYQAIKEE